MLENQPSFGFQQIAFEYGVWDRFAAGNIVWWVGEDDVELFGTTFQVQKGVRFDRMDICEPEILGGFPDKTVVDRIDLDGDDRTGPPGCEFIADRSGTGKEVQNFDAFQIPVTVEHVEQILFGEIGGRSRPEVLRGLNGSSFLCTANDSHGGYGLYGLSGDAGLYRYRRFYRFSGSVLCRFSGNSGRAVSVPLPHRVLLPGF